MSKNIFLSGIYHETHTFLGEPTTLKDFIIFHDEEIINENTGNGSPTPLVASPWARQAAQLHLTRWVRP